VNYPGVSHPRSIPPSTFVPDGDLPFSFFFTFKVSAGSILVLLFQLTKPRPSGYWVSFTM